MNERERYDTNRDARRDSAARPERAGRHEEVIGRFVGALLYGVGRREHKTGKDLPEPSEDKAA